MEPITTRLLAVAFLMVVTLANVEGTTCYSCSYVKGISDNSSCLNPSSSTPTCSSGTECVSYSIEGAFPLINRGCASGGALGCKATESIEQNTTICFCSGDLCNTGSTAPAPIDGPATICYLCNYYNTNSDTSNCLNPSSSTPTCSSGTQCINFFSNNPGGKQISRGCSSGVPLGCMSEENNNVNQTSCACSGDRCNTGSTAPAPSYGPAITCYLCTYDYDGTPSDTNNCLNPSSSTPTCSTGTQCSNFFSSASGGATYSAQITRGCASSITLGCTSTESTYANNTLCFCSSDLCNTGIPTQVSATQVPTTLASTQVFSGGPAIQPSLWNVVLLTFTGVASFALAQGNVVQ